MVQQGHTFLCHVPRGLFKWRYGFKRHHLVSRVNAYCRKVDADQNTSLKWKQKSSKHGIIICWHCGCTLPCTSKVTPAFPKGLYQTNTGMSLYFTGSPAFIILIRTIMWFWNAGKEVIFFTDVPSQCVCHLSKNYTMKAKSSFKIRSRGSLTIAL